MPTRTTLLLLIAALGLCGGPAAAQVTAPAPVDEAEPPAPPEPPPRPGPGAPASARPSAVGRDPSPEPAPAPDPTASGVPDTLPAPRPPPAEPPPERPAARAIQPVTATHAQLLAHWDDRRAALREQDPTRAAAAAAGILEVKRQLAIGNLFPLAATEVREAGRALAANLPAEALAHAELAEQLAPDSPDARLAAARARLAVAGGSPLAALGSVWQGLLAAAREPHTARAFQADVYGAFLAAVLAAAAATVLLLLLRSLRLFLHDVHHLPLLRGTAAIQAGFLALVLLLVPAAFGLGPFLVLATAAVAAWLYLGTSERVVVTLSLIAVAALPWAAEQAARATAWTGTLAEAVHELEHGAPGDEEVAALAARAAAAPAPPALAAALGRHHKRRGDLEAAMRWYREAARADERNAEVQVNIGNVLFLQGDLEGAKAAYLAATDRAGGDLTVQAAAHYDLSKVYLRSSDIEKSSAARDRAEQEDGAFLKRYGADDDFSANRYLVDVPVPDARIRALAAADGMPGAVGEAVRARLSGPIPRAAWPWGPLALAALLWLVVPVAPRLDPARACDKCGRPACRRCDGGGGPLCGQCVNVYVKKGVVEARDRLRKESQVRRRRRLLQGVARALAVAGGGAGHVFLGLAGRGAALLTALLFLGFVAWTWRGVLPPPQPWPHLLWGKLAVVVPAGLAVYLLAVRDLFRRTRS